MQRLACVLALGLPLAVQAQDGLAIPECVHDTSVTQRFLPVELITGEPLPTSDVLQMGPVDRTYPFTAYYPSGAPPLRSETSLKGPVEFRTAGGRVLAAYERVVPGATERMALTDNAQALGRVYDERIGHVTNEGKYPVGLWKQGETRHFNAIAHSPRGDRPMRTTIHMEKLSCRFEDVPGAYSIRWTVDGGTRGDYGYVFAPGRGLVQVVVYKRAGS